MQLCEGPYRERHDEIVHDGECPVCAEREQRLAAEGERDAALERALEAEQALAAFETDLVHAMRMLRVAKAQAEADAP